MPIIDTLARHMAALREARRLTGLVLANNGAFVALQAALNQGERDGERVAGYEAMLSADPVYLAYEQLGRALDEIAPMATPPGGGGGGSLDTISALSGPEDVMAEAGESVEPVTLGERLAHVLTITAMADETVARPVGTFVAQRDEARVAILHRHGPDCQFTAARSGDVTQPGLVQLFR